MKKSNELEKWLNHLGSNKIKARIFLKRREQIKKAYHMNERVFEQKLYKFVNFCHSKRIKNEN